MPNLRPGVDGPSKAMNLLPATNCAQLEMISGRLSSIGGWGEDSPRRL